MGRQTTYGDYSRTGGQDCLNAFGVDDVDFELGDDDRKSISEPARSIMEANMLSWEENGSKEDWFQQNDVAGDDPHLDPEKAYQAWRSAWLACATTMVQEVLEESHATARREHQMFYLFGDDDDEMIEGYDEEEAALRELARLPKGKILRGDANGPEWEMWAVIPETDYFYGTEIGGSCCLAMMDELRMQRALARSRQWRANPRNPYEVRSPSGKEEEYADRDDAEFHADELRRAGVRGVEVVPRTRSRSQRRAHGNPTLTKEQAERRFFELLQDPDPNGMEIAQDLVLEHGLSLVELGEKQAAELGAKQTPHRLLRKKQWESSMGYFRLSPSFSVNMGPPRSVLWTIDATNRMRHYMYIWGDNQFEFFPGGATRTDAEARRAAAADCWVIAKALKNIKDDASWSEVQTIVDAAYVDTDDPKKLPKELFGHRDTRKPTTYAEARANALQILARAGWEVRSGLKIPWAESPNHYMRLWFRPQAVWASFGRGGHSLGGARSISGGSLLPDMRSMTADEFMATISEMYREELKR